MLIKMVDMFEIDIAKGYFGKLTKLSREDNEKSLKLIRESGIQFTEITNKNQIKSFYEAGKQARHSLVGKLYDEQLLDRVENTLDEFRKTEKTGKN